MKLANVNKMIYLEDFYNNVYFTLDMKTLNLKQIEKKKNIEPFGFVAQETCGFLNKKNSTLALFCINNRTFMMFDYVIFDTHDIDTLVFSNFVPLVQTLQVKTKDGNSFVCKRWSKNIDEFEMDDFLYFMKYSYKENFSNICSFQNL